MSGKAVKIDTLSFEEALTELESIVRALESGKAPLEESISAYSRGVALKDHCAAKLRAAELKVETLSLGADGTPMTAPFARDKDAQT